MFFLAGGWVMALWFSARWQAEEERAEAAEYALSMAHDQLRAAGEVIDARDSQLRNANDYINRQREQMRQLASEKPMTFGGVPMYHAAHLHKSCDNRQLWLMWDN